MKQIEVAAGSGVAETRLNAIERSRVVGPAQASVEQIGRAMSLSVAELEGLLQAGAHDRCMREISRNWTHPYQLELLAAAMDAARVLSEVDSHQLARAIRGLVAGKEGLRVFTAQAEVAMT